MPKNDIKLLFLVASRDEIPSSWIRSLGYGIFSPKSIKSGALKSYGKSVAFVVTGVGRERAIESSKLILNELRPMAVINIGTCGLNKKEPIPEKNVLFFVKRTRAGGKELDIFFEYLPFPILKKIELVTEHLDTLKAPLMRMEPSLYPLVDMEAGFQHQIFNKAGIPFLCVKIPSDFCSEDTDRTFKKRLPLVREGFKGLLSFLDVSRFSPKVSVIIPVFNRPNRVKRAIPSVLAQSLSPFEVILVDDGSSPPIKKTLSKEVPQKIRLIELSKNRGVSYARNIGIKEAKGDFIALCDSDDEWKRDKLKNQVEYLKENPFFEIIQCNEIWIRNGRFVNQCKHHEKEEGFIFEKSMELCAISPSGVLFRKELIDTFGGFNEKFPACEDYELWLRITRFKPVGLNPQRDLIKTGGHRDQLSRAFEAMDRFRVMALLMALSREEDREVAKRIKEQLKKRLVILYNGATKRKKEYVAKVYLEILKKIESFQKIRWQDYLILLKKSL